MNKLLLIAALLVGLTLIFIGCKHRPSEPEVRVDQITPSSPKETPPPQPPLKPSQNYMNGYWDGYHGKWLGPFRWTFDDDYRQGRMQGVYDRENGINRFMPPS